MPRGPRWSAAPAILLVAMLTFLPARAAAGPKTDVIVLNNGDRLTAEIKQLDRGSLSVKTDALGTAKIHWADVVSLTSATTFEVEAVSGARYYGALAASAPRTIVVVAAGGATTALPLLNVVRMVRLEASFWSRLDGSVDLGFNFTQANHETQWTLNATSEYRKERYTTKGTLSSLITAFEDASRQSRNTLTVSSLRAFGTRSFTGGVVQLQQDEALDLNFRSVLGAAIGHSVVQRSDTTLSLFAGPAYTRESFVGQSTDNSAEALVGSVWDLFTPGETENDLTTSVITYFSLTSRARARIEFATAFKRELLKDFYWSLNTFDSYDSSPPEDQKKNDFGISITLGWKF